MTLVHDSQQEDCREHLSIQEPVEPPKPEYYARTPRCYLDLDIQPGDSRGNQKAIAEDAAPERAIMSIYCSEP
jgi:hypothetical protein